MQRSLVLALACAATALQAPRLAAPRLRLAAAESEECVALLGFENLSGLYAQWGICVETSTAVKVGGLQFTPQDTRTYETETVEGIVLTRSPGLGVELLEVANNDEGVGIVVVDGTVEGSSAADSLLQKGDVLAFVGAPGGPFESTEAKTWDDTVDALGRVDGDRVELVIKRLVKRPVVDVTVKHPNGEQPDQVLRLFAGENLRRAMLTRRVALNDPLARRFDDNDVGGDCGSGGACCTCAVAVMDGADMLTPAKTSERQIMKTLNQPRFRLACKTAVGAHLQNGETGKMTIRINPRQHEG